MLFYECCAADAWPLMGGSAYIQRLSQQEQWNDFLDRMIIGDPVLQPYGGGACAPAISTSNGRKLDF